MKPFDLQAALSGAKLVTRDGREVSQFLERDDLTSSINPYKYAAIIGDISDKDWQTFDKDGRLYNAFEDSHFDLFMAAESAAPKTRTMWVNYYRSMGKPPFECERIWFSSAFDDKIEAEEFANSEDHPFYIATLPIEIP